MRFLLFIFYFMKGCILIADISSTKDFISSLEIAPRGSALFSAFAAAQPGTLGTGDLKDGQSAGLIDAGSLTSFVAGVSLQHQQDALNSCLLAQLAANKQYDRESDTQNWYRYYVNVLEKVGWVIQGFNFDKYNASGSSFTVDAVIIEVLQAIMSADDEAVIQSTMNALKALNPGDGRLHLWQSNTTSAQAGNFQIAACSESNGVLAMKLGAFYMNTSQSTSGFLWFSYSSSNTSIYKSGQVVSLNEQVYAQVRATVIQKLGSAAQTFVANLDI